LPDDCECTTIISKLEAVESLIGMRPQCFDLDFLFKCPYDEVLSVFTKTTIGRHQPALIRREFDIDWVDLPQQALIS